MTQQGFWQLIHDTSWMFSWAFWFLVSIAYLGTGAMLVMLALALVLRVVEAFIKHFKDIVVFVVLTPLMFLTLPFMLAFAAVQNLSQWLRRKSR